jgi:hypothetical protein
MRWEGHVLRMGEENKGYKVLEKKHEEKETTGKTET